MELAEAHASLKMPPGAKPAPWRMLLAFVGCGAMVSVGYMDPGNWSTGLAGGARYGYALLCVVLLSSMAAMFLQHLSLKLGVASGRDLAQACKDAYPRWVQRGFLERSLQVPNVHGRLVCMQAGVCLWGVTSRRAKGMACGLPLGSLKMVAS